jgi:hypothetical protein
MRSPGRFIAVVLTAWLGFAAAGRAQQVVLVLRPAGGEWKFEEATRVLLNGKSKLRLGSPNQDAVGGNEYKRLETALVGAVAIRTNGNGAMVRRAGTGWAPVAPDGASVKASVTFAALWSAVRLQVEKGKQRSEVNGSDVFAMLPGSLSGDAVVAFLMDAANFAGFADRSPAAAFEERMSLLVAVAGSASEQGSTKLKTLLLTAMDTAIHRTQGGVSKYSDLQEGLRFSAVSAKAFPSDPQQARARDKLNEWKAWLDLRMAILRALAAGEHWDAFINKYGEFERFDNSFDDLRKMRERAYAESAAQHLAEGERLAQAKQYQPALGEVRIALLRMPGDRRTQDLLETIRLEEAREHARMVKHPPVDLQSPTQTQLNRDLHFAEDSIRDGKLEEAEEEIAAAEALDKESPRIMLMKARLLQARNELRKALEVLDGYDRLVSGDEEIGEGETVRDKILYQLKSTRQKLADQIGKAESDGDYVQATSLAVSGSRLDPENPYFLYHAGLGSAIVRHEAEAEEYFRSYLRVSQAVGSERKLRAEVFGILPILHAGAPAPRGTPNWFSGYPVEAFYCPISLMPSVRPGEVRASRKQTTTFEWHGGKLASVNTVDANPGGRTVNIYFDYFPNGTGVRRVSTAPFEHEEHEPSPVRLTAEGTIGPGEATWFALFNYPAANPYMVERLTGRRVATVVTGNPYFHPFVWMGIYVFLAEYDGEGHIRSATQIGARAGAGKVFDFAWAGNRLLSITERGGDYQREMHYAGDRLIAETVHFGGKTSKIEYKYEGDRLVEANCETDFSIDGRSRHVTFRE